MAGKTLHLDIELSGKLNPSTTAAFTKLSAMATKTAAKLKTQQISSGINQIHGAATKMLRVVGTAAIATGIAFATVSARAVKLASDLVEIQNVVDVTFGKDSKQVDAWSKTVLDAYGLSELSAKHYVSVMGAMFKSSGVSSDNILKMSKGMTQLTGDIASFYNKDPEEAFTKIQAGLAGQVKPLRELGINMTIANLENYALSQGMTKSYKKMTQAEQIMLRYSYLLSVTKDAQGDFTRTQGEFANQMRLAKEKTDQLMLSIADHLLPQLTPLIQKFNDFIGALKPEQIEAMGKTFTDISMGAIQILTDSFNVLSPIVKSTFNFIKNNGDLVEAALVGLTIAFAGLTMAQWYFNAAAMANPYTWIILAIVAAVAILSAAIFYVWKNWDKIMKAMTDSGFVFINSWDTLINAFGIIWNSTIKSLGDIWNGFVWGMSTAWSAVWGTIVGAFKSYMNIFIQGLDFVISGLNTIPGVNIPLIPVLQGGLIPGLAIGATVNRATLAMIGEAGTETVVPHNSKPRSQALALEAARGTGVSVGNNINITFAPVINGGGSVKEDLKQAYNEFESQIERYFANKERVSYGV